MQPAADPVALRQCVLAVSVLADVDVEPADDGVRLPGTPAVVVTWDQIAAAVGSRPPSSPVARRHVEELLRLHATVARLGSAAAERLRACARVVALPPGHADHPGPDWVQERLLGGALDLGVGVSGILDTSDRLIPLPKAVMEVTGAGSWGMEGPLWPHLRRHLDRMGALSVARLCRGGRAKGVIRPVGGCDVLSLLASPSLRSHLATGDGTGLRAVAVPMRQRGWYDIHRIDPAFVGAAWSATDELERGMPRPVLVTADEVTMPEAASPAFP